MHKTRILGKSFSAAGVATCWLAAKDANQSTGFFSQVIIFGVGLGAIALVIWVYRKFSA